MVQSVVQETLSLFEATCFRFKNRQGILRRKCNIFSYLCSNQNLQSDAVFSVLRKWLFLVSGWAESLNAFCSGNQNWKPHKMYLQYKIKIQLLCSCDLQSLSLLLVKYIKWIKVEKDKYFNYLKVKFYVSKQSSFCFV